VTPNYAYRFTVFTATYNRETTLPRVFRSLQNQTFVDFEWIVVDDGSTDGTRALVQQLRTRTTFPVKYIYKENGGKHSALQVALREAGGELFLTLDSDDECVNEALEVFNAAWMSIPVGRRPEFSAVTALCCSPQGERIGSEFPNAPLDSNSLEVTYRYRVSGEKWGFQRTDIMRDITLPSTPGYTGCVPEGLMWAQIARRYQTRYINRTLRIYHDPPGPRLMDSQANPRHAYGAALASQDLLMNDRAFLRAWPRVYALELVRLARWRRELRRQEREMPAGYGLLPSHIRALVRAGEVLLVIVAPFIARRRPRWLYRFLSQP
jgi:glycosyltransferase involved in cell wall biosynthesis